MKDKKVEFRYYTVPEWQKEEAYLRERHNQGWKFTRVTFPGLYYFEACEPEDVVYQLDYNQEGFVNHGEYIRMFADCGWEYIQDFVGYSYFRKRVSEMNGEEQIFCDDESRLDMIKRVYKGRITPLIIIFFCCIIPQMTMQALGDTPFHEGFFRLFLILFFVYLYNFLRFGYEYYKLKKRWGREE